MSEKVVFSQLSRKFIDENDATPAEAQQVVYYSLAIGHHLGVIDCLEAALTCPWDDYLAWIATLEAGSEARRKMEGVPKYGEIVIDINHVPMLANAFDKARAAQTSQQRCHARRGAAGGLLQPGDWSPPWGYRLPGSGTYLPVG